MSNVRYRRSCGDCEFAAAGEQGRECVAGMGLNPFPLSSTVVELPPKDTFKS